MGRVVLHFYTERRNFSGLNCHQNGVTWSSAIWRNKYDFFAPLSFSAALASCAIRVEQPHRLFHSATTRHERRRKRQRCKGFVFISSDGTKPWHTVLAAIQSRKIRFVQRNHERTLAPTCGCNILIQHVTSCDVIQFELSLMFRNRLSVQKCETTLPSPVSFSGEGPL